MTLNPALDLTYAVDALIPHATHRVTQVAARAGGKGLNVAAVLHALGEPVLATGILGGGTGAEITTLLDQAGLPASFVTAPIESRRTVAVVDGTDATGFWEPGPTLPAASWETFVDHFRTLLPQASVVALCGSLPPGIRADGYAVLTRLAAENDVPVILDTSGPALREGLAARPHIVKPNAAELADLIADGAATPSPSQEPSHGRAELSRHKPGRGRAELGRQEQAERVRALGARAVVASRGPDGLLAVTADGTWQASPPAAVAGNPTGAGDACVAALARGLRDRRPWPELLPDAVALSAAAVAAPVAGSFDPATYDRIRAAAIVEALPGSTAP